MAHRRRATVSLNARSLAVARQRSRLADSMRAAKFRDRESELASRIDSLRAAGERLALDSAARFAEAAGLEAQLTRIKGRKP